MKKVYIITIDEVYDFENFPHEPMVFADEKKAREEMARIIDEAKEEYKDKFNEVEEGETYFEMYAEGYFSEGHYAVHLYGKEVEE
jgi:hypothetical protein